MMYTIPQRERRMTMDVILASASPRRKKLLANLYSEFRVIPSDIRELVPRGMQADRCPEYLAHMKAEYIAKGYPKALVIGCDTSVIIEGKLLNKPRTTADARTMMHLLSGKVHQVITGCCLYYMGHCTCFSEVTQVEFYPLTEEEIEEYINTSEPYDKAGGYGVQNKAAFFIKGIRGDYYNVVGLPMARLKREIDAFMSQDFSAVPSSVVAPKRKKRT